MRNKLRNAHWFLFKPLDVKPQADIHNVLHHVVNGDHDAVKAMLRKDSYLIFKKGKVIDCSGRIFENISPLQYTLWALDKHMWTAMLDCFIQNEDCVKIIQQLSSQYNEVKTKGVSYRLNNQFVTEHHFNFENTIIKALQKQDVSIDKSSKNANDKRWRKDVGGAQKLLPMHVVYEFCFQPFYPLPQFISQPKSTQEFYHWNTRKNEHWFDGHSRLGVDFAIHNGLGTPTVGLGTAPGALGASYDLAAIKKLREERTKDFVNFESQLEQMLAVKNQPSPDFYV